MRRATASRGRSVRKQQGALNENPRGKARAKAGSGVKAKGKGQRPGMLRVRTDQAPREVVPQ